MYSPALLGTPFAPRAHGARRPNRRGGVHAGASVVSFVLKQNALLTKRVFHVAGTSSAGFEYHPLNEGVRPKVKRAPYGTRFFLWRGGQDSNLRLVLPSTHLAGEPIQPLWHLPVFGLMVSSWQMHNQC